ncbi:hypothetical protein NQ314_017269 [Rhamnusium bicolor]|uniref:Uncharacterized protein n=1 Tax=Rhamnusium bicolor TaxID=1586634 RepID=A0AAV8WWF4_9CUCU|nr:hypothetical protein NQ314_017269 [Rhamnusium bicolor]
MVDFFAQYKLRHFRGQRSIKRVIQDVRDILVSWVADNRSTNWADGLRFIQLEKIDLSIGQRERVENVVNDNSNVNASRDLDIEEENHVTSHDSSSDQGADKIFTNLCFLLQCTCAPDNLYGICIRQEKITQACEASFTSQKRQADEMLQMFNKNFLPASIGQHILVKIPDADRGRAAPGNVVAVVMEQKEESDLYQLGTLSGVLEKLYARNEFQVAYHKFMEMEDVPEKELTLRTAAAVDSRSKQGFVRCDWRKNCENKRCNCLKKRSEMQLKMPLIVKL